jgi:hypothetical protein
VREYPREFAILKVEEVSSVNGVPQPPFWGYCGTGANLSPQAVLNLPLIFNLETLKSAKLPPSNPCIFKFLTGNIGEGTPVEEDR